MLEAQGARVDASTWNVCSIEHRMRAMNLVVAYGLLTIAIVTVDGHRCFGWIVHVCTLVGSPPSQTNPDLHTSQIDDKGVPSGGGAYELGSTMMSRAS